MQGPENFLDPDAAGPSGFTAGQIPWVHELDHFTASTGVENPHAGGIGDLQADHHAGRLQGVRHVTNLSVEIQWRSAGVSGMDQVTRWSNAASVIQGPMLLYDGQKRPV